MDQPSEYERFEQCSTLDSFPGASDADTWLSDVGRRSEGPPAAAAVVAAAKKGATPLKKRTVATQPPRILPKENSGSFASPISSQQHAPQSTHRTLSCKKDSNRSEGNTKRTSPQPPTGSVVVLSLQKSEVMTAAQYPSDSVHFRSVTSEDRVLAPADDDVTFGARFAAFQSPPCASDDKRSLLYTSIDDVVEDEQIAATVGEETLMLAATGSPPRLCLFAKEASPQMGAEEGSPPTNSGPTIVRARLEPSPATAPCLVAPEEEVGCPSFPSTELRNDERKSPSPTSATPPRILDNSPALDSVAPSVSCGEPAATTVEMAAQECSPSEVVEKKINAELDRETAASDGPASSEPVEALPLRSPTAPVFVPRVAVPTTAQPTIAATQPNHISITVAPKKAPATKSCCSVM